MPPQGIDEGRHVERTGQDADRNGGYELPSQPLLDQRHAVACCDQERQGQETLRDELHSGLHAEHAELFRGRGVSGRRLIGHHHRQPLEVGHGQFLADAGMTGGDDADPLVSEQLLRR
jgi:hypothetical protein